MIKDEKIEVSQKLSLRVPSIKFCREPSAAKITVKRTQSVQSAFNVLKYNVFFGQH
jgi:hypothetical protein